MLQLTDNNRNVHANCDVPIPCCKWTTDDIEGAICQLAEVNDIYSIRNIVILSKWNIKTKGVAEVVGVMFPDILELGQGRK